jgi:murein DD-endopeptidase MepM/ murein hydrolase activator NlpD
LSSAVVKNHITRVMAKGTKQLVGTGRFMWPVGGHISSMFGSRSGGYHKGLDIAAPMGSPVYAADSGTVSYAGWYYGYGKLVIIDHGNGYQTYYGHNGSLSVSVGQSVARGQKISAVGMTGQTTGPHCHFEVRLNGVARNPMIYLK